MPIPISSVSLPLKSLRVDYGDVEELAKSIQARGLLYPIMIRPIAQVEAKARLMKETGKYEVVAGCRRFLALVSLDHKELQDSEYILRELDDKTAFEIALIENVQRQSMTAQEEAKAFMRYVIEDKFGSIAELAKKIDKHPMFISERIGLLKLPDSVFEKLGTYDTMPLRMGVELSRANVPPEKVEEIANLISLHYDDVIKSGQDVREVTRSIVQDQNAHPDKEVSKTFLDVATRIVNSDVSEEQRTAQIYQEKQEEQWDELEAIPDKLTDERLEWADTIARNVKRTLYEIDTYVRRYEDKWPELHKEYIERVRLPIHNIVGEAQNIRDRIKKAVKAEIKEK